MHHDLPQTTLPAETRYLSNGVEGKVLAFADVELVVQVRHARCK